MSCSDADQAAAKHDHVGIAVEGDEAGHPRAIRLIEVVAPDQAIEVALANLDRGNQKSGAPPLTMQPHPFTCLRFYLFRRADCLIC